MHRTPAIPTGVMTRYLKLHPKATHLTLLDNKNIRRRDYLSFIFILLQLHIDFNNFLINFRDPHFGKRCRALLSSHSGNMLHKHWFTELKNNSII